MLKQIKEKLAILPDQPGCYLMKDEHGVVIYVGKAKVLKNRVRSYFTGAHDSKTTQLVEKIDDFEYIITSSDLEALLLEMNLIKKYDPKFNIKLKDDKTYPYLKITNERHPRLLITRVVNKSSGKYFGPYPHAQAATEIKRLLDRLYPLRKCKQIPSKICLYYHLGQCLGPCEYKVEKEAYQNYIQEISKFLAGGHQEIKQQLLAKMQRASEKMEFEIAKEYRDQIAALEKVIEKQNILTSDFVDRDVFGYFVDKGWMCVQVFFIRQGKLIERKASLFDIYNEPEEEFLTYIGQFYDKGHLKPKAIFLPKTIDEELVSQFLDLKAIQPKRGQKKELVDLATKNAKMALYEKFALIERDEERTIKAIERLADEMGLSSLERIEAFDNSNIQGVHAVSAMIVFVDGKPAKSEYRKYKIKTVEGTDDYLSMREVVRRRYTRLLKERAQLPDLIIVDGGKGHMTAVIDVLENELGLEIPVAGLAKDDKHRTSQLLIGDPPQAIDLKRNSQEFYLLQRIQDEVHRFAITFHRQVRSKSLFQSQLDGIPGLGVQRKKNILKHFGSVKKIKEASIEEIIAAGIPEAVAKNLQQKLQQS